QPMHHRSVRQLLRRQHVGKREKSSCVRPIIEKKLFPPNGITVANNGASVGYAFFQPVPFTCSHNINPLYLLNRKMSPEIGLLLCSVQASVATMDSTNVQSMRAMMRWSASCGPVNLGAAEASRATA